MLKIELAVKFVAGLERGGIDLFLVVKVTSNEEPLAERLSEQFDSAWQACINVLSVSWAEAEQSDEDLWIDSDRLMSCTDNDGFYSINKSLDNVKKIVRNVVDSDDWILRLHTKIYEVSKDVYIDGNAG